MLNPPPPRGKPSLPGAVHPVPTQTERKGTFMCLCPASPGRSKWNEDATRRDLVTASRTRPREVPVRRRGQLRRREAGANPGDVPVPHPGPRAVLTGLSGVLSCRGQVMGAGEDLVFLSAPTLEVWMLVKLLWNYV